MTDADTAADLRSLRSPAAVIFDMDGTLVDTVEARIDSWMGVFEEEAIEADREQVARLIGADGKRLAREVAERAGRMLNDEDLERVDKRSGELYDELCTDPQPTAGAGDLLVALEGGALRWAIATSSRKEQTGPSITALGLADEPVVVDGSHVEHAKPAPDLLLQAAERLDTPPDECWYVGDATWDMMAARAAGMVAIGVPYGAVGADDLRQAGADAVTDLPGLLAELTRREI